MNHTSPFLSLKNIAVNQGKNPVLREVNIDLDFGKSLLVVGDNGAGKTTFLQLLCGLKTPSAGTLTFKGDVMNSSNMRDLQKEIAYIPQNLGLVEHSTVQRNILLGVAGTLSFWATLLGRFSSSHIEKAKTLMHSLGIADLQDKKVGLLSSGQRKKVAIARAFMGNPSILLIDEMLSDLAPKAAEKVLDDLSLIQKEVGFSTIFVEHHVNAVIHLADTLVTIERGQFTHQVTRPNIEKFVRNYWLASA